QYTRARSQPQFCTPEASALSGGQVCAFPSVPPSSLACLLSAGPPVLTQDARKEGAVLPAAPPCVLYRGVRVGEQNRTKSANEVRHFPNPRTRPRPSIPQLRNETPYFPISVSMRSREPRQFPRPALPLRREARLAEIRG